MSFLYINETDPNFLFLQTTDQRISDFLKLPQGWHYGEGNAPNEKTVDDALRINNQATLLGLKTEAFPGVNGEIQMNCYLGDTNLEFTIEPTGEISLIEEKNDIEISNQENMTVEIVFNFIREKYGKTAWNSFEQSTQSIITHAESDFKVWRSRIPLTQAEYRFYPALV